MSEYELRERLGVDSDEEILEWLGDKTEEEMLEEFNKTWPQERDNDAFAAEVYELVQMLDFNA